MSINTLCIVLYYVSLHGTLSPSDVHILGHKNALQFLLVTELFRHNLFLFPLDIAVVILTKEASNKSIVKAA
jgi:hypothetical protein